MDAILLQKHPLKHFRAEAIVRLRRAVLRNLLCKPLGGGGGKEFFFPPLSSSQASVCEDCFSVFGSQRAFINQHVLRDISAQPRFGSDCGNTGGHVIVVAVSPY